MTEDRGKRKLPCWKRFQTFVWNGETREFLCRTALGWGRLLLFYTVFYAVLAAFIALLFTVFWQTLDMEQPKWQLDESLIGTSPGLTFRPMPPEFNLGNTLVQYNSNHLDNMTYWYDAVDEFLEDYVHPKHVENVDESCTFGHTATTGKFCPFKIESLDNCLKLNKIAPLPCQHLKKIYNWTPKVFTETSADQLSDDEERKIYQKMPQSIKYAIANTTDGRKRDLIWVSCEGERAVDVDNIRPVHYSPQHGFPAYFYPFKNVEGYQAPIVAVQFEEPKLGVIINIECKAWAKNVIQDRIEGKGSVRFGLMID